MHHASHVDYGFRRTIHILGRPFLVAGPLKPLSHRLPSSSKHTNDCTIVVLLSMSQLTKRSGHTEFDG